MNDSTSFSFPDPAIFIAARVIVLSTKHLFGKVSHKCRPNLVLIMGRESDKLRSINLRILHEG
jgi:hypothetical protein